MLIRTNISWTHWKQSLTTVRWVCFSLIFSNYNGQFSGVLKNGSVSRNFLHATVSKVYAFLFIRMKKIRGGSNILSISILFSLKYSYNIPKFKTKATKKKKEQEFLIYLTVYLHRHCVLSVSYTHLTLPTILRV